MAEQPESWLKPGHNCWRIEEAERFRLIVDAADYFEALRSAMLKARHSILLIGWDFDARIPVGHPGPQDGPDTLGAFLPWLADRSPQLEIRLLRWGTGALKSIFRGSTLFSVIRWKMHARITLRFDTRHPFAGSHHQKIVVIDDCLAFCGGIDVTEKRWDTPEHLDDDPRRVDPLGRMHPPWHDTTSVFDGDAARAMGDLARARWARSGGGTLTPAPQSSDCWPDGLKPNFTNMRLAIARTVAELDDEPACLEVEEAWLDLIHQAKRVVYAESQYFASRRIAHAIAERLIEPDPPEFVLVTPHQSEGWLEPLAMDTARAKLVEALRRLDHAGRFRIYHPQTAGGNGIYVHSKLMVVDDLALRVGSSNFNNRSLRLDSECDVILCGSISGENDQSAEILALRDGLLAEHLGVSCEVLRKALEGGSMIQAVEALRGAGRSLVPYELPELSDFEAWLAENEILDPNGPSEIFESTSKRGLFKGWGRLRAKLKARGLTRGGR